MNAPWIEEAKKHIGLKEISGVEHEGKILRFWTAIKNGGIQDDETPWCAAFVGSMLENCGIRSTRTGWAKDYLKWGSELSYPVVGCIAVLSRKGGGGHVFFATAIDERGRIGGIGGNQGNAVSFAWFDRDRVLGYRWPTGLPLPYEPLKLISSMTESSTNEA